MAKLPWNWNLNAAPFEPGSSSAAAAAASAAAASAAAANSLRNLQQLVLDVYDPDLRVYALKELSKKKDQYQDLAPLLWHSFGIVAVLLQEIVLIYPNLLPPSLTAESSLRVCDTLALLQCVASHPDTRMPLITSHAPLFVYPFLYTENKSNPFNHLRLSSLGVIGALVKAYKTDTEVILFLLRTEITPMLLRSMEMGDELSRKLATFIVQKILLDDTGLEFVCSMPERFIAICEMLSSMVAEQPSLELLKYIIGCYLRLSENARVCDTLKSSLPDMLKDATFFSSLKDNSEMREWLQQLLHNVLGPTFGEKPLFVEPS